MISDTDVLTDRIRQLEYKSNGWAGQVKDAIHELDVRVTVQDVWCGMVNDAIQRFNAYEARIAALEAKVAELQELSDAQDAINSKTIEYLQETWLGLL